MSSVSRSTEGSVRPLGQPPQLETKPVSPPLTLTLPSGLTRAASQETGGSLHNVFNKATSQPVESVQALPDTKIQNTLPRTLESTCAFLKNAVQVTQSTLGNQGGVLTLRSSDGKRIVMKFVDQPESVTTANMFYERASVKTAKAISYPTSSNSMVGREARTLLNNHFKPSQEYGRIMDQAKEMCGIGFLLKDATDGDKALIQMELRSNILVMDYINGTSWTDTDLDVKKAMVQDRQFAKDVGKMALLDLLLGYGDRLISDTKCNAGNFMVCRDDNGSRLAVIDNEMDLSNVNHRELKQLMKEENRFSYLANHLIGPYSEHGAFSLDDMKGPDSEAIMKICSNFCENGRLGIIECARDIVGRCSTESKTREFCEELGLSSRETETMTRSVEILKKALNDSGG